MLRETWKIIPEFPSYSISTEGRVRNDRRGRSVSTSINNFGHTKVNLCDKNDCRRSMSVALLVAQAFVNPPDDLSDNVILLDGHLDNIKIENLALRPRWFAWKYSRQLRTPPKPHYWWPVYNDTIRRAYPSIVACGMEHGLLFSDIWRAANVGGWVYPYDWSFEFMEH